MAHFWCEQEQRLNNNQYPPRPNPHQFLHFVRREGSCPQKTRSVVTSHNSEYIMTPYMFPKRRSTLKFHQNQLKTTTQSMSLKVIISVGVLAVLCYFAACKKRRYIVTVNRTHKFRPGISVFLNAICLVRSMDRVKEKKSGILSFIAFTQLQQAIVFENA